MAKRILIAGGGHSSLPIIKMGKLWQKKGYSISLITSDPYLIYSGGLPQYMGGFYSFDEISINLKNLCKKYHTDFIQDKITSVNSRRNLIKTESGGSYDYDVLLINTGAVTNLKNIAKNVYPVKPMSELLPLLNKIKDGRIKRLLIAGGGAAGTEIALNLSHPCSSFQLNVTLFEHQSSLLSSFPGKASQIVSDELQNRGVTIKTGRSYSSEDAEQFDAVIDATGNRPSSVSFNHDLVIGHGKRILTEASLLALGTNNVFAAGDTADVDSANYAAVGVHAVKQGPLLRNNIIRLLEGRRLDFYKPYPVNPLILSNGNGDAIFTAGGFCSRGPWASLLKFVLDMHWIEKYTQSKRYRRSIIELINAAFRRALKK